MNEGFLLVYDVSPSAPAFLLGIVLTLAGTPSERRAEAVPSANLTTISEMD